MNHNRVKNKNVLKTFTVISWLGLLSWMGLIFYLSSQPGEVSGNLSQGITAMLLGYLEQLLPMVDLDMQALHYFVRKNAHFIAYLILGLLSMNAVGRSGWSGKKRLLAVIIICVLYAGSDEFHQLFVPGRSGQVSDVLIDSLGSAAGILLYSVISKSYRFLLESNKRSDV